MLKEELAGIVRGEVLDDPKSLAVASRDASIFEIMPEVVVCPKDTGDLKALVKFVSDKKKAGREISLTARSGGTDMSGGTLTESVVVDFSKHINRFISLDPRVVTEMSFYRHSEPDEESRPAPRDGAYSRRDSSDLSPSAVMLRARRNDTEKDDEKIDRNDIKIAGYATAEPGMFYRDFERETLKKEMIVPSYPASRELCTIGGMVANNSGGEKTLSYGKTEDYIQELKMVLADGEEHVIRALDRPALEKKLSETGFEGEIYRKIYKLIDENYEKIRHAKPDVSKNSAGYYLWNVYDREKGVFDLTRLMAGSQGTLGLVSEITFRLVKPRKHSLMAVIFLRDLSLIAEITNLLLKFNPESLECYDDKTLKLAIRFFPSILARVKSNFIFFALSFLPDLWLILRHGFPKLVILAELTGDEEAEIYDRLEKMKADLRPFGVPVRLTRHEAEEQKYWTIRRESFNLLRQHVRGKHTVPVVDDIVVKPEYLAEFLPELDKILSRYASKFTSTLAGHAGNGNFHVIPLMDFKDPEARALVPKLMDEVYALTLKYGGSITAEHNDGLVRTPYLDRMFGREMTGLFREVKDIFDPLGIFNPGKKVPVKGEDMKSVLGHMQTN